MGVVEDLEQARADFERGDWAAAFEAWSARRTPDALAPPTSTALRHRGLLLGRHDDAVRALQRAFVGSHARGDLGRRVRCAFRLAMSRAAHGEPALAAGWAARAERLLARSARTAWSAARSRFLRMFRALGPVPSPRPRGYAAEAAEAGRRHARPPTCSRWGSAPRAGWRSTPAASPRASPCSTRRWCASIAGEVSPVIAGHVYCTVIEGCQEISDFGAGRGVDRPRWSAGATRSPGWLAFTGQCAVHRGQLMRLRGAWAGGLEEFERASRRYAQAGTPDAAGLAAREAGDVLRLRGDYDAADAAYQRAADHGFDPQPGLALLWLAQGRHARRVGGGRAAARRAGGPGAPLPAAARRRSRCCSRPATSTRRGRPPPS